MESLGEKLKTARETKGYDFDQAARETNIARRYLEALEEENFSLFPGEAYLLGFLRNYGEYLGMDVQALLSLYRGLKLQEQSVPEQLLHTPSRLPGILLRVLVVILILAAGAGIFYFFRYVFTPQRFGTAEAREPLEYTMTGESLERRLYRGDSVLIPLGGSLYKIQMVNLGEAVTISAPGGNIILDLSQEVYADLNQDGFENVRITAAEFAKNNSAAGAMLRFDIVNAAPSYEINPLDEASLTAPPAGTGSAAVQVIFESANPHPFTLEAKFQSYCMFRWESDRQSRNERYFTRSDELNIQAQNGIRLWLSNAAAVKFQVIGGGRIAAFEAGGVGEVVVADLRWVNEGGRSRLILTRLD